MDEFITKILLQGDSTSAVRALRDVGDAALRAKDQMAQFEVTGAGLERTAGLATRTLTNAGARLGADVGRYSFIVSDSHRLLLAGLPAHSD